MSENIKGESHPEWRGGEVKLSCANCGQPVSRSRAQAERSEKHFCDARCHGEWRARNQRGERHPQWRGGGIAKACEQCGELFETRESRLADKRGRFCSRKCKAEWQSENLTGEWWHHYKGGPVKYYGPNWKEQRDAARKRDGHKCWYCGVTQEEYGRKLPVHHIVPFREFGYIPGENENYKLANNLLNLITLCISCHNRAERGKIPLPPGVR
jgi:endogenous inhibitor of DNA gyrase (YacG/DUF329 family)